MRYFPWDKVEEVLETVSKIDVQDYLSKYGEGADRLEVWFFLNSFYKGGWYLEDSYPEPETFPEWFIGYMKHIGCIGKRGKPLKKLNRANALDIEILLFKGKDYIKRNQIKMIEAVRIKDDLLQ